MSSVFKIDTDSLDAISNCLSDAKINLDSCVSTLDTVTSHDDWTCKERKQINELLNDLKKKCHSFAYEFESNSLKIKQESEFYHLLVKDEIKSGLDVDSKISELLSVLSGTGNEASSQTIIAETKIKGIVEKIRDEQLDNWAELPRFHRNVLYNVNKPISMIDYKLVYKGLGE